MLLLLVFPWCGAAGAYSLLTHEQLIDLTWKDSIVPLLLSRYPSLTPAELEHARAYAYGGCVIQDIGYYPFGDRTFSNLTHYVRTGDFIVNIFRNAQNADELAFAIGALSHYIGDTVGHSVAVNLAVAVEFPKLRAQYGPEVSYAEGVHQHIQTEFAFDIYEIAHRRMAPVRYLRHIGLGVPVRQLSLAFYQTYGLSEDFSTRRKRRINVHGYRFAVRAFIPRIAYAITILRRHHEPSDSDTPEALEIESETARVAAECDWQAYQRKPGIGTYTLAGFLFILPKIGPLKMIDVKGPTAATEATYVHSVVLSTSALRNALARFTPPKPLPAESNAGSGDEPQPLAAVRSLRTGPLAAHETQQRREPNHPLLNRNLDTGRVVEPGGYAFTDSAYANLLHQLALRPAEPVPPGIKKDIEAFYSDPNSPITTKKDPARWAQVEADLVTLGKMATSTEPMPYPTYGDDVDSAEQGLPQ